MTDPAPPPRRTGWVLLTVIGAVMGLGLLLGGLWALRETVRVQGSGSGLGVLLGAGSGLLFWGWITAGAWRRATEPEPDLFEPSPVPRRAAFVVANIVLAVLFTAIVGGGFWATVTSARDEARVGPIEHRVEVAARAADVTVDDLRALEGPWQAWLAVNAGGAPAGGADPISALLPVAGATVQSLSVTDDTAAVLFRPVDGPPCVVLHVDADDLISTRQTRRCS